MKVLPLLTLSLALPLATSLAQAPSSSTPSAQPQQSRSDSTGSRSDGEGTSKANQNNSTFLGDIIPSFNPGSEVVTWDGQNWNINNNRLFEARFEKFLNAPEETDAADAEYNAILDEILDLLSPGRISSESLDKAFKLLPQASEFERDANLGDAIANQVYSAWSAVRAADRLNVANQSLEEEKERLEWNQKMAASQRGLTPPTSSNPVALSEYVKTQEAKRTAELQPITTRLVEIQSLLKANQLKQEVSELQSKIEFQSLIVMLFLQRRFEHVLIATRFYRGIFSDGDSKLRVGEEANNLFSKTTGLPPTIGTLDALASEAIRDVNEGVEAFEFLLSKEELESATKRLAETFTLGEYMPSVRTLPREEKRKALSFVQISNELISALDVKDYERAELLVKELERSAKDFDNSKPMAAIETAKTLSAMHLAKAKNAAVSGDRNTLEEELRSATEIWPRNPNLKEVSSLIFSQADVHQRALVDFDQLLSQKNYRQIYDDRIRFIAATAMHPEKGEQLRLVLENMGEVEKAIIQAQEIEKRGDYAGAWESVEEAFANFPQDNKLNQVRADLTTQAADFVRALRTAQEMEERDQYGSSLAWYLKARNEYPQSSFARDGIDRVVHHLFPDAR